VEIQNEKEGNKLRYYVLRVVGCDEDSASYPVVGT
jgi:hypothetical protein